MRQPKIAIMASASGTILDAIIEAGVPIGLVLADKECKGIEIAQDAHIPNMVVSRNTYGYHKGVGDDWDREGFTLAVAASLKAADIDVVAMVGFFTILHPIFFNDFAGHILNIHPALLPLHPGEFAVRDTLAAGDAETGSTIHIATEVLDDATYIVAQSAPVLVLRYDDVGSLWERIKVEERKLYPQVLKDIISGAIDLDTIYQAA